MLVAATLAGASAQVIEFEQNGLKYQTLTHGGVTVMFAHLPAHVREFSIIQVSVSNGSRGPYTIRPEDFVFERADHGDKFTLTPARYVVDLLLRKGIGQRRGEAGDDLRSRPVRHGADALHQRLRAAAAGGAGVRQFGQVEGGGGGLCDRVGAAETGARGVHRWRGLLHHRAANRSAQAVCSSRPTPTPSNSTPNSVHGFMIRSAREAIVADGRSLQVMPGICGG